MEAAYKGTAMAADTGSTEQRLPAGSWPALRPPVAAAGEVLLCVVCNLVEECWECMTPHTEKSCLQ